MLVDCVWDIHANGRVSRVCPVLESKTSDRDGDQTVYMCVYIHDFVYDYAYVCVCV